MKFITRDTDYAMRALLYISASDKDLIPSSELIDELNLPKPFIRKILQILQQEGVLTSTKGPHGGFALAMDPQKILLTDLIRIFQGEINLVECIFRKKVCRNRATCPLRSKLKRIESLALSELKSVTVGSLLKEIS
ncbi:MAG: Rrf2 family transcriptional regulator [Candidatus Omnitrophota bacterium]